MECLLSMGGRVGGHENCFCWCYLTGIFQHDKHLFYTLHCCLLTALAAVFFFPRSSLLHWTRVRLRNHKAAMQMKIKIFLPAGQFALLCWQESSICWPAECSLQCRAHEDDLDYVAGPVVDRCPGRFGPQSDQNGCRNC